MDRLGMNMLRPPPPQDEENRRFETREKKQGDWCRFYWDRRERIFRPAHFIFVGLDMGALESARVEARRRTILMSGGVVLIALAGTLSLFLAQGYRLTRRSLAKVRAFSDQVVENLPVGLVATDELGRVAAFNETAETILAVPGHRVLDGAAAQALPPELWALSERIDRKGAIIEEDLECQTVRQSSLPLRVSAAGLRGENSAFLGYVFIFRDLTEVRRLEQEVERSRRLAAIGNLAAGVAHEIRNPLSSIKGFATYFRERFKDEPQDQNTADTMIQEVERLDRVIGQLLEFARPSGLKIRPVRVDELIEHSLKLVESDARTRGVEVTSTVPADLSPIAMDADRMNQVLLNLYLNAIQAMNKGGTLDVEVTRDEQSKQTRITVADTGPGIDPSDRERIFDPYFTTKPAGTGLGLTIVHKIMEAHGGDVDVYSASNTGTMVTLILPDMAEDEHVG
ncbi:MAG: PAS domain S-box protein [Deltaproteobacteria bacterium]|nr:PAS domain S-box protein [Deltaproteobacteria bacterium]